MRADPGATGLRIALPVCRQGRGKLGFGGERRHRFEPALDCPDKCQPGAWERTLGLGTSAVQPADGFAATGRDGDTLLGHHLLERSKPSRVGGTTLQQSRALAQRLLVSGNARGMGRIKAQHQPIEKPPPATRAFEKEAVHRRRQPDHAEPLAEHSLAACRLAVDAHDPSLA